MSEQDTMRLVAELLDKTSGPLKDIQKSLRATADVAKSMHGTGAKDVKAHAKSYHELTDSIGKAKTMISGVLGPAMAALGITGFAAGEAIGKLVGNLKDAAENYHKLNDAAKRGGGTVDDVNARTVAYGALGVSIDRAVEAYANLGYHADRLKRGNAEELNSWNVLPGAIQAVGNSIKNLPRSEQVPFLLDWLDKHPNTPIDQKRIILQLLGQPEELATATGESIHEALQKGLKFAAEHPDNPVLMKGLAGAFDDLDIAMKGLAADMVEAFGNPGIAMVKGFAGAIHDLGDEMKIVMGKKDTLEKLDNGVWEKANPIIKWLANPTMPSLSDTGKGKGPWPDLSDRAGLTKFKDAVTDGVVQGLETYGKALSGPGGSGYQPMAYHPDGGGNTGGAAGAAKAFHDGGGFKVLTNGGKGDGGDVPAGNGPVSGLGKGKRDVASIAAQEWRAAGMTDDGIAGIMGNVREESNFNPTLRHPDQPHFGGEAHFAHGLYQEGGTEWNHYEAWLKKNYPGSDWRDPALQSRFAAENLKKNYPGVWNRLKNAKSRVEAAQAYASGYLKPAANYLASRNAGFARHGVPPLESFTGLGPAYSKSAYGGGAQQKITGDASLGITLNGFPKGTRTDLTYGGLFTSYNLTKGRQMELSEQK